MTEKNINAEIISKKKDETITSFSKAYMKKKEKKDILKKKIPENKTENNLKVNDKSDAAMPAEQPKPDTNPDKPSLLDKIGFLKSFFEKIKSSMSNFPLLNKIKSKKNNDAQNQKPDDKKNYSNKELIQKKKKKDKIIVSHYEHKRHLKEYLEKAGYTISDEARIAYRVNIFFILLVGAFSVYLFYTGVLREDNILFILIQVILSWLIILPTLIVAFWVIFYFVIDFKIFNRRKELEEVLPDFLQLTSANINAGMPLDQALWYAVRPRFGILAKEIEEVAKSTLVGEDLGDALTNFSKRYDSLMLKRTVNLMLEGLDAGGQIGPLLNKISIDIQETRIIKKDMAANVTTYVIFISFATLLAAPFLFALSTQLLYIIQSLMSNINIPAQAASGGMLSISLSKDTVSMGDFKIFAICALIVTSFFSAIIISTIRYGNVREGIKYIPIFIITSVFLYIVSTWVLNYFLGGILLQ